MGSIQTDPERRNSKGDIFRLRRAAPLGRPQHHSHKSMVPTDITLRIIACEELTSRRTAARPDRVPHRSAEPEPQRGEIAFASKPRAQPSGPVRRRGMPGVKIIRPGSLRRRHRSRRRDRRPARHNRTTS